nr:MAG TPA: hypothetical protein [Caudoviricetes sp.]
MFLIRITKIMLYKRGSITLPCILIYIITKLSSNFSLSHIGMS